MKLLALVAALALALALALPSVGAMHSVLPSTHVRAAPRRASAYARLGELSGEFSRRMDFRAGRICETGPHGREVCRNAKLSDYDSLERDLAEVPDFPSWWVVRAEREFRASISGSALDEHSY